MSVVLCCSKVLVCGFEIDELVYGVTGIAFEFVKV